MMIRHVSPKVYDTAHLHGVFGVFKRLALLNFFTDAKARYDELKETTNGMAVQKLDFRLEGETASRYNRQLDELAHEAGFDSLLTAQLFAYLRAINPALIKDAGNKLFLYRSIDYVDLDRLIQTGQVGTSMFDLSRVTLLVAALDPIEGTNAASLVASSGALYKWMDATHILVVLRASGGAAVRKAAELAGQVHGVVAWMGFEEWKAAQASFCDGRLSGVAPSPSPTPTVSTPRSQTPLPQSSASAATSAARRRAAEDGRPSRARHDGAAAAPLASEDERSRSSSLSEAVGSHADDDALSTGSCDDDCGWTLAQIAAAGAASATLTATLALVLIHARSNITGLGLSILRRWGTR
eukprot:SRR837773.14970.p2 GENE.SRR837773.14970~~SRR837773.14970.p2  ORF type:complete len:354 (-),score=108.57 SRR837773.14970:45-1106(-)